MTPDKTTRQEKNSMTDNRKAALERLNSHILGYDNVAEEDSYCCYFTKEEFETIRAALSAPTVPAVDAGYSWQCQGCGLWWKSGLKLKCPVCKNNYENVKSALTNTAPDAMEIFRQETGPEDYVFPQKKYSDAGMVLVPREPTDEMLDSVLINPETAKEVWRSMIAAIPPDCADLGEGD